VSDTTPNPPQDQTPAPYQSPPPYQPPPAYQSPPQYQAPPAYQAAPGYPQAVAPVQPMTDADQRLWAMLGHLGGILIGFIAPLVVMLVFGERSPFVRRNAVEALNFNITVAIASLVAGLSIFMLIGLVLLPLVWIGAVVLMIIAGLAANKGQEYRYPINLRLVH
jgi:uncharacterized protein